MFSFKIQMYECKHSYFTFWNFKIFCKVWFFLTVGSSNGEGLSQLYLELVLLIRKDLCFKMYKLPYSSILKCGVWTTFCQAQAIWPNNLPWPPFYLFFTLFNICFYTKSNKTPHNLPKRAINSSLAESCPDPAPKYTTNAVFLISHYTYFHSLTHILHSFAIYWINH